MSKSVTPIDSIILDGVSVRVGGSFLINGISVEIPFSKTVGAIQGPNGSGKSTFLRVLAGDKPDASELTGRILLVRNGISREVSSVYSPHMASSAGIVFVPQEPRILETTSVLGNLLLGVEGPWYRPYRSAKRERLVRHLLDQCGLDLDLHKVASKLTAAEKQKVGLVRGLVQVPNGGLLLLDEATTHLTEHESSIFLKELTNRCESHHITTLFCTHIQYEIKTHARNFYEFRSGRIYYDGILQKSDLDKMSRSSRDEAIEIAPTNCRPKSNTASKGLEIRLRTSAMTSFIDLVALPGELVLLRSESASNSHQVFRDLCGIDDESEIVDTILYEGQWIQDMSAEQRRRLGWRFVPADRIDDACFLQLTVRENLMANISTAFRLYSRNQTAAVHERLAKVDGLSGRLNDPMEVLSGGFKQRVILERELDDRARLLVAHNPFQGLDATSAARLAERFREWTTKRGCITLLLSDRPNCIAADQTYVL